MGALNHADTARQQQRLLQQIFSPTSSETGLDPRGLAIYRENLRATACQALGVSYPTVLKLIGEELFRYASDRLLEMVPPDKGDWALWGEDLAYVLSTLPQLDEYPFVPDCARLDWMRHQVERAQDSSFDQTSLKNLIEYDLNQISLVFADSTRLLMAQFPVIEAWQSNHAEHPSRYVEAFNQRLSTSFSQQTVLLYRPKFQVKMLELNEQEKRWMEVLMAGRSIGHALDELGDESFAFDTWLARAVQGNWIAAVKISGQETDSEIKTIG